MNFKISRKGLWIIAGITALVLFVIFAIGPRSKTLFWRIFNKARSPIVTRTIVPNRGEILDCNGNVIATNKTVYDVHMDCCVVRDQKVWERNSRKLAQEIAVVLPEKTAPEWWEYFQKARTSGNRYIPIVKGVERVMVDSLSSLTLFKDGPTHGGFICTSRPVRVYPYGKLARRTIGVLNSSEPYNSFGLERTYHYDLIGTKGYEKIKVRYDRGKRRESQKKYKKEINGWNIITTLDMEYQALADSILRDAVESDTTIRGGCLMLMDVHTGKLKAIANTHRFDNGKTGEYFNYILDYYYEPGAVAHTMTLAAAISDGIVSSINEKIPTNHGKIADNAFPVDDYIRQYELKNKTDSISILDGFAMSSRYVASNLALRYSGSPDYFKDWLSSFFIDHDDFQLSGVREVLIPLEERSDSTTLRTVGEGFGYMLSPLHIIAFYNALANHGEMVPPEIVSEMQSDEYGSKYNSRSEKHGQILRPEVAQSVCRVLSYCVDKGTGQLGKNSKIKLAGKTGTSRVAFEPSDNDDTPSSYTDNEGRSQYASTFAGFYPTDSPKYTVLCALFTKPTHRPLYGGLLPTETAIEFVETIENLR